MSFNPVQNQIILSKVRKIILESTVKQVKNLSSANTGSERTVGILDFARVIECQGNTSFSVTLNSSSLFNGWYAYFSNKNGVPITLTPSSGLIDGNSSFIISSNCQGFVYFDGTNFFTFGLISGFPVGFIYWHTSSTPPSGFLKANGAAISRTSYANLFSVCGTTYGAGNGTTTFNLPDLRGEFIRGLDDGRGVDSGRTLGSFQANSIQSHTHSVIDGGHSHPNAGGSGAVGSGSFYAGQSNNTFVMSGNANTLTGISIGSTGGIETRPRNIALLACIKY
jgi:microcystin-dependent protein